MMIDNELLDILACPETKEPVKLAEQSLIDELNAKTERGELTNRGGEKVERQMDGGLVREDGKYLYPIEDEIPIMLIDEAIPLEAAG
ncbi:MAG: Trm112 family protein [Candidatus Latescibacterota bacterium]|nr:Trm112 family protein [Candidatus Latescibacterota bacterium]